MTNYKPMGNEPKHHGIFFLVRPKGIHPTTGKTYVPCVVQQIDGEFYSADNEIEHLEWGLMTDIEYRQATRDELEWCELPS